MGCTASKLDNEDTVRRCKERRRLMKEAVYARHHLAAAHSDYCRSLRITGSALVTFASGEPLSVSHHAPAVLLRTPSSTTSFNPKPKVLLPRPSITFLPFSFTLCTLLLRRPPFPLPPPSITTDNRRHRFVGKSPLDSPTFSQTQASPPLHLPTIISLTMQEPIQLTRALLLKLLQSGIGIISTLPPLLLVLNTSSNSTTTRTRTDDDNSDDDLYTDNDNDDKASSFTSYSNVRDQGEEYQNPFSSNQGKQFDDRASNYSSYSRYSESDYAKNSVRKGPEAVQKKGPNLKHWESEEEETEREEVQCSEWGDHDHYSSTSSSSDEDEREDLKSRSDFGTRSNFGSVKNEVAAAPANTGSANLNANSKFSSKSEKLSSEDDGKSSVSWGDGNNERGILTGGLW
ncbi:UNVERIFIED_CONTAM: Nitrate regulatoryprotein [Sesamum radiatum]|uniref:Nitrate regulatoryprotein n=1 Tax=Sesamum radiatum TaxID=300843 RepID=A0AAW2V9V4_SESRA